MNSHSEDHPTRTNRRGQLLLVGAVVLAIVIVVLSLVVNTVLFTQNTNAEGVSAQVENVEEFEFETGKTTRSILLRVNHAAHERNVTALQEHVSQSIRNYSDALERSTATSGTAYANASDWLTIRNGTRLIQPDDRDFNSTNSTDPDPENWEPISAGNETDIGWYLLNVDLRNVSAQQAQINITGDSEYLEYSMNRSENGNGNNLSVAVSNASTAWGTVNCTTTGGRVLVDLVDGDASLGQCSFPGIEDTLEPPYDVEIENGDRIYGTYSIVTGTEWDAHPWTTSTFPECDGNSSADTCSTPAVWNGSINLTYTSSTVQYAQQRNVTVYGGDT